MQLSILSRHLGVSHVRPARSTRPLHPAPGCPQPRPLSLSLPRDLRPPSVLAVLPLPPTTRPPPPVLAVAARLPPALLIFIARDLLFPLPSVSLALAAASFLPSAVLERHSQHGTGSAASPGAAVPAPSLPAPAPASLPSLRHAEAQGPPPLCLVCSAAPCWAGSSASCHRPTPTSIFLTSSPNFQLFAAPNPVFCPRPAPWLSSCSFSRLLCCPCRGMHWVVTAGDGL